VVDCVKEGIIPQDRSRECVHLRRRLHPLGGQRQYENPGLEL
jgi:hypothetical protein